MKTPPFSYAKETGSKAASHAGISVKSGRCKSLSSRTRYYSVIIDYCIEHSLLFETANYHNAVLLRYDSQGVARYAAMRGTKSAYKRSEVTGSDKHFSFFNSGKHKCNGSAPL